MLAKLIKYDLKFVFKSVIIFIVSLWICAALFNLTDYDATYQVFENTTEVTYSAPAFVRFLHAVFQNGIYVLILATFFNAAARLWIRFNHNLFHDEAYLTHTLPVTRATLWAGKFLSAVITILIVIASTIISLAILSLTTSGELLAATFGFARTNMPPFFYPLLLLTIFTQLLFIIICGFTGITISQKLRSHRGLWSRLCGLGVYLLGAVAILGILLVWSAFDEGMRTVLFDANSSAAAALITQDFFVKVLAFAGVAYTAMITVLYFVNQTLLTRGIDID